MDPATVEVNMPSRSNSTPAVTAVHGQYKNFGGGDALLNRLPPSIQKRFWTIVTVLVVLNAVWLLIIFCIAVAAIKQTNDLEDDMQTIFRGEADILKEHTAEIEHLDVLVHPYSGCKFDSVDSIYHECLLVSNSKKTYAQAKEHCDSLEGGKVAFPRSASEFAVLAALAVSSNSGDSLKTFMGIRYEESAWKIENPMDGFDPVTEEAAKNFWELNQPDRDVSSGTPKNCGVLERGPAAFNKMVSADCDEEAYYICAIMPDYEHHHEHLEHDDHEDEH